MDRRITTALVAALAVLAYLIVLSVAAIAATQFLITQLGWWDYNAGTMMILLWVVCVAAPAIVGYVVFDNTKKR